MKRAFLGLAMACAMGLTGAVPAPLAEENLHPLALALELSVRIPDRSLRITERVRVALVYWEAGMDERAEAALALAMDDALGGPGPLERGKSLFRISGRLQKDHAGRALEVLDLAVAEGGGEWPDSANTTLAVASRYLALGATDKAIAMADGAGPERAGRWHAEAFAKHLHKQGDTPRALAMQEVGLASWREHADEEKDWNHPLRALAEHAERMLDYGGEARAVELLGEAALHIGEADASLTTVRNLANLVTQAARAKSEDLAEQFLAAARERLSRLRLDPQDDSARLGIAKALVWVGRPEAGAATARSVGDELIRWQAESNVVREAVAAGYMAEALEAAMSVENDDRRSRALNRVGRGWVEQGEPKRALEIFLQVPTRAGIRAQESLLHHWRTEGDLASLLEFIERATIADILVRAVDHATRTIEERGATEADLPALMGMLVVVGEAELERNYDTGWWAYSLEALARQFSAVGRQEEAIGALRLADETIMRYSHADCDVSLYPPSMAAESEAKLERCREEEMADPMLNAIAQASNLDTLAETYARIGEYGLALEVARRTGTIHNDWLDTANDVYPILSALRRIGKAYLKNGDQPSPEELVVLEELRDQALGKPDWRVDPLGAAIVVTGRIEDTTLRAEERGLMVRALEGAGFAEEAGGVLDLAIGEALALESGADRGAALAKLAAALYRLGGESRAEPLWDLALEAGGEEWLEADERANFKGRSALRDNTPELLPLAFAGLDPYHLATFRATAEFEWRRDRGETEIAREALDEGVAAWRDGANDYRSSRTRALLYAEGYLEIGAAGEARSLLGEIEEWPSGKRIGWYVGLDLRLAVLAHRAGDDALAGQVLEATYAYILAAPERLETRWWKKRGFQHWWRRAVGIDDTAQYRDGQFGHLAEALVRTGREGQARMVLAQIRGGDELRGAYVDVAKALADQGEEARALALAEALPADGPGRQGVLSGVAWHRADKGDYEGAWQLWRQVWHEHGSLGQDKLLRHWRDGGAVDRLVEFIVETPQNHLKVWGVRRAAEALMDRGPDAEDKETLEWLQERLLAASSTDEYDHAHKARVLAVVARVWHRLGEQERAEEAMEEAELYLQDLAIHCPQGSSPDPPTERALAYCNGLVRPPSSYSERRSMRATEWAYGARGWAQIGEFGRAMATVESAGLAEANGPGGLHTRLIALRGIGITMLEQGALPPSYLESLVDSARQGDLVSAP